MTPALFVGGGFAQRWAAAERGQIELELVQKSGEIASDVDREISAAVNMLIALATSNWLRTRDFEKFHRQATEVARQLNTQIVLLDPRLNRQIVNTAVQWGTSLPQGIRPEVLKVSQEAISTGKFVVSNVFVGPLIGRPAISVGVPAEDDLGVYYYLAIGLPTDKLAPIVQQIAIGPDRLAAIVDRNNVFISRSQNHVEFSGTPVRSESAPSAVQEGVLSTTNRDGTPFYWFFRRTPLTGWVIGVGIPASILNAPVKLATTYYGFASGVLLIIAVGLAYGVGPRLVPSFGTLGVDRQPTREEFRILFDTAPHGVVLVDQAGSIALTNARMATKFGYSRNELIGKPVEILMPAPFREEYAGLIRNAIASAPSDSPLGVGHGLIGRRKDGSEFPLEVRLNPINTGRGRFIVATVVDISARKQAAERLLAASNALRASEHQRELAMESAKLGAWTWDFLAGELWWSGGMREILGVPKEMPANSDNYHDRVHLQDRHIVKENTIRYLAGGRQFDHEYRIVRFNDQAIRWINSKGRVDCDDSGAPQRMHGIIQDVTVRREADIARDELRRRLMQAQENERLHLAHELHDQTGQSVAAIMLELKQMEPLLGEKGRGRLQLLRKQFETMAKALHHVALELRPASIDELGFESVLSNYVSEWSRRFDIETDFHCDNDQLCQLPDEIRTVIYRVIQEALTNVAKHATGAKLVSIIVDSTPTGLQLTIEDDGSGFDIAAVQTSRRGRLAGLGIAGMRERLTLIGGALEIESSLGIGTTVFARFSLDTERLIA